MSAITYPENGSRTEDRSAKQMLQQRPKRQTFEMDLELHARLKMASAKEGIYIREILTEATKAWLRERGY